MQYNYNKAVVLVILSIGIAVRGIVSLSSYSGAAVPPMFGDYEAQRHWQEITYNLPANQWYLNTTDNNLLYWGIDYPPLTAYHSFFLGLIANRLNTSYVELFNSRGIESISHKSFMRLTVLASDLLVYIPAVVLVMFSLKCVTITQSLPTLMLLLYYPCQILIDNGHFQYNNISLALFIFSVVSILHNRHNWSCFAFSLALNYKQMELYHALPIFVYLLKASFTKKSIFNGILSLVQVGFITVTTFVLLWLPWISSLDSIKPVVLRLFPLNRGVFEDKVANVWCSLNVVYKFKENLENDRMALICLVTTVIAIVPTNLHLFYDFKKKTFLYALVNTSLSFFLLSFQVHEKSILLAAVPISFVSKMMPFSVVCFLKVSTFSILPLLVKDNLSIIYFSMYIAYLIIFKDLVQLVYSKIEKTQYNLNICMGVLDISILIASLATLIFPCPERLPYFWSFVVSFFSCIYFIAFLLESSLLQFHSFISSFEYFKI